MYNKLYNKLPENEKPYALLTNGSCHYGKALEVEDCCMESHMTNCRKYWMRWIESICRIEGHPPGFRYCWMRKVVCALSLYWFMDGRKCPVEVVIAMEAEKLAAQRQSHLGCCVMAIYCCHGREPSCKSTPRRCSCAQELGLWRTSKQPAGRSGC